MEKRLPLPTGTILQGRYRIVRQLGHGGFGAVYEAVDDELNLSFALKETFYAADEELRQAFKREARMLASLSHEAFPRVTHYFTEGDGCFLVMELIYGDDLDKLLAKRGAPFDEEQVLDWADQILDALEDLHAKGIIHRDIKPSNLKLTTRGKIKLLDFGIAKGAVEGDATILTTVGSLAAATLEYAPLEQVLKASPQYQMMLSVASSDNVMEIMKRGTDATSDLYALAATLYHLLVKRLPADAPTRALAVWSNQEDRLIPAHAVDGRIEREVSDVLQKALSLDRDRRYQTAAELRQALSVVKNTGKIEVEPVPVTEPAPTAPSPEIIYPESPSSPRKTIPGIIIEPVKAFAVPSSGKRLKSKSDLRSTLVGGILFLAGGLVIFLVAGLFAAYKYVNNTGGTNASTKNTNSRPVISSNKSPTPNIPADAKYKLAQTLTGHIERVRSVAFSPDGKTIVSGSWDDTIKLWDAASGNLKQTLTGHKGDVKTVVFSPDGKTIASGGEDNTIKLWDAASGAFKQSLIGHSSILMSVVFSPDGKTIISGSFDDTIKLWDTASGDLKQTLSGHKGDVFSAVVSSDGKTIASGSDDNTIKLWDAASGDLIQTLVGLKSGVLSVAFSPDGKAIASGRKDNVVNLWDAASGNLREDLTGHSDSIGAVAFSPDGKTIASGSNDNTIKLWDAANGDLKQTLTGHSSWVISIAFSPDGKTIASGSIDNTIKLWRIE